MRLIAVALLLLALAPPPARAVLPDEMLDDPALEARARDISRELRCVVCQNQSIEDSNAKIARDMRLLVRSLITDGLTNDEIFDYIVARYGDFVLLNPPMKPETLVLWYGPAALLAVGLLSMAVWYRRRTRAAGSPHLTPEGDDSEGDDPEDDDPEDDDNVTTPATTDRNALPDAPAAQQFRAIRPREQDHAT